jgi:hypothetical protein
MKRRYEIDQYSRCLEIENNIMANGKHGDSELAVVGSGIKVDYIIYK